MSFNPDSSVPSVVIADLTRAERVAPRCTVGLLTWNPRDEAWACIRALLAQRETPLTVMWVDNGSTNGLPGRLQKQFDRLPPRKTLPANIGFCGGHNLMLARCRTPYYLALSQDVVMGDDYIEKLCDWMDEDAALAMTSGLIVQLADQGSSHPGGSETPATVYSAGMAFPRSRFPFELGMGGPISARHTGRAIVPGVDGCAMILRAEACRGASLPPDDVLPPEFFAYMEEVDLALRLARRGWRCGMDGTTRAIHEEHSSGGFYKPEIGGRFIANHWLASLRNEGWGDLIRDLPFILKGELFHWLPIYLRNPRAWGHALKYFTQNAGAARRFYHAFEKAHGPTREGMRAYKNAALKAVRER